MENFLIRTRRPPVFARVLALIGIAAGLVGCGGDSAATVPVGATVMLRVGQRARVSFGQINPGIGDSWTVTAEGDPRVVVDHGAGSASSCPAGEAGCPETAWQNFQARGRGATRVSFQYCYRSAPPDCRAVSGRPAPPPITTRFVVR